MQQEGTRVYRFVLIETKPEYILEIDPEEPTQRISVQCATCRDSIMLRQEKCFIVDSAGSIARGKSGLICQRCGDALLVVGR